MMESKNKLPLQYLDYWEDIEGVLRNVKRIEDQLILTFEIRAIIEIPYSQTHEELLKKAITKQVGILKTDFEQNPYRIVIKKKELK